MSSQSKIAKRTSEYLIHRNTDEAWWTERRLGISSATFTIYGTPGVVHCVISIELGVVSVGKPQTSSIELKVF